MDFSTGIEESECFGMKKYPSTISASTATDAIIIRVLLFFRGTDIGLKASNYTFLSSFCGICCPIAVIISLIELATLFI